MSARPRLKVVSPKPYAAEGARFRAFVDGRWGRAEGGIRGLATEAGTTPETLYAWFRGDNLPGLGSARAIAKALGSSVLELVAAIESQPVPSTTKEPAPEWAETFQASVIEELTEMRGALLNHRDFLRSAVVDAIEARLGPSASVHGAVSNGSRTSPNSGNEADSER